MTYDFDLDEKVEITYNSQYRCPSRYGDRMPEIKKVMTIRECIEIFGMKDCIKYGIISPK